MYSKIPLLECGGYAVRVAWRGRKAEAWPALGWNKSGSRLLRRCSRLRERPMETTHELEAAPFPRARPFWKISRVAASGKLLRSACKAPAFAW